MSDESKPQADQLRHFRKRLRDQSLVLRQSLATELATATVFLIPHDSAPMLPSELNTFLPGLGSRMQLVTTALGVGSYPSLEENILPPAGTAVGGLFLKNMPGDEAKKLLEQLFSIHPLQRGKSKVRLSDYGVLLPMTSDISCYSFAHGIGHYYRYRLAKHKLHRLPIALQDYLTNLPARCPNDWFLKGPRGSSFETHIEVQTEHVQGHVCSQMAAAALSNRKFKNAHEDVEKHMLESDTASVAAEVPIWLEPAEMERCGWAMKDGACLTGHIDVLRWEADGCLGIWDFKPDAAKEEQAHMQVYLYALMLSLRTGIPLETFHCGYFDSKDVYQFAARQVIVRPFPRSVEKQFLISNS